MISFIWIVLYVINHSHTSSLSTSLYYVISNFAFSTMTIDCIEKLTTSLLPKSEANASQSPPGGWLQYRSILPSPCLWMRHGTKKYTSNVILLKMVSVIVEIIIGFNSLFEAKKRGEISWLTAETDSWLVECCIDRSVPPWLLPLTATAQTLQRWLCSYPGYFGFNSGCEEIETRCSSLATVFDQDQSKCPKLAVIVHFQGHYIDKHSFLTPSPWLRPNLTLIITDWFKLPQTQKSNSQVGTQLLVSAAAASQVTFLWVL